MISLGRCNGSCHTLDDPSSRTCVPNKRGILNLTAFDFIIRVTESKTLAKQMYLIVNVNFIVEDISQIVV